MGRAAIVLVLHMVALLSACGQRGALTLPPRDADAATGSAPEAPVASTSETTADPDPKSLAEEEADGQGADGQQRR